MNTLAQQLFDQARAVRFVVVGVGAAALLFALSWSLTSRGMAPFLASTLAYAVAFAVAYTAQRNWTFGGGHAHGRALPRYFALQAGCAVASGLTAHVAVTTFHAPPVVMSAATVVVASGISYVASTLWVFADRHRTG